MKLTRRQMALAVASGVAAGTVAAAPAQNPPAAPNIQTATTDWDIEARAARRQSAQALTKVDLPMLVEPAFQFKA